VKGAFERLLESRCKTIRKFLSVWTWIDTVLALGFPEETASISHFKVQWWIIAIHEVTSTNSVHTVSKKWGRFSLFLQLHFGGAVTPMPQWESWFPALPKGTWMDLKPEELSQKERAFCRILSDKRGLPAGDFVTKREALEKHLAALTKGNSLTKESRETLINYSEIEHRRFSDVYQTTGSKPSLDMYLFRIRRVMRPLGRWEGRGHGSFPVSKLGY
jgi:hypothetical protein